MRLSRSTRRAFFALALLVAAALPALAQKSTISSRSARSSGGFGGASSGRLSPVAAPRAPAGPSTPAIGRPTVSAPTLSPGFRADGRQGSTLAGAGFVAAGGRGGMAPVTLAGAGTLSPGFPVRGRETAPLALAPVGLSASGGRSTLAGATGGKRFLPVGTLPVRGHDSVDDWHKRSFVHHGTRVILFDPFFFGDPFFFHTGFFVGDGFFFNDPFFFGHRFVFGDPFFFGHRFGFGRPLFFGPGFWNLYWGWPGFWTGSTYGSGVDYANGYSEGFEQGYSSGRTSGYAEGGYGLDLQGSATPDAGYVAPGAGYAPPDVFPPSERFAEGRRRMAEGRYSAALSAFDAYVREAPSDGRGKLARGVTLLAMGRVAEAAQAFRRGVDDYAPGEVIVFDMPALFGTRSAFRGVQGSLEDNVRRRADDLDGRFDLGVLYLFSGERDAAQSLLGGLDGDPYADRLLRQALGG